MRATRIAVFVAAGALLAASLAVAAGHKERGPHCRRGERLSQSLGLTDAQKTQIKGICEKYRGEFEKVRSENTDREAKRARAREVRQKMHTEIGAALTPAQRDKLQQMRRDSYKGEWRKGPHARRGGMMQRLTRELSLTPEQREKVRAIYGAHRDEARALMQDAKAQGADRAKIRERGVSLREKVVAEVRPILTPEQQQKLDTLVARWNQRSKS